MGTMLPHVGIVMVTVRDAEEDMVQALNAGADDYITKPFRFGELVARLRAVLRRAVPENTGVAVLRAGDLEIDFDKRCLRRAGKEVHLTVKPRAVRDVCSTLRNGGSSST